MGFRCGAFALAIHLFITFSNAAKQILCDNGGAQFAVFNNTQGRPADKYYSNFNPNYMKDPSVGGQGTKNLIYSGTTAGVGGWAGICQGNFSVHGSPRIVPCENNTLMYRGYIYPVVSGIHAFNALAVDDALMLWVGPPAQRGWHRRNDLMESSGGNPWPSAGGYDGNNVTYLFLSAGTYYPFRIVHAQSTSYWSFLFAIIDPFGTVLFSTNTKESANIVQYSCDGSSAPPFPYDWGKEA